MKTTVINLGWCIAKLEVEKKKLTIISPAEFDENWHVPTQEIILHEKGIVALRNALNVESAIDKYSA